MSTPAKLLVCRLIIINLEVLMLYKFRWPDLSREALSLPTAFIMLHED